MGPFSINDIFTLLCDQRFQGQFCLFKSWNFFNNNKYFIFLPFEVQQTFFKIFQWFNFFLEILDSFYCQILTTIFIFIKAKINKLKFYKSKVKSISLSEFMIFKFLLRLERLALVIFVLFLMRNFIINQSIVPYEKKPQSV